MPDSESNTGDVLDASDFGTAASHSVSELPPVLVGPATAQEFNTVGLALPPVACMSLHDLVFETDSSFVMPDAARVLRNLPALRRGHKSKTGELPVLSIFAHADPSGSDEYNKALSGRRAKAVYGLLLHDVTVWDGLYNSTAPGGGDDWKKKNVLATIRASLGDGAPVSRPDLFLAYMKILLAEPLKPTDFLGQGAANGKASYQGCSDFNPLLLLSKDENKNLTKTKWQLLNQPNRRVVLFLFSATRKIDPSQWPCPLATEGTAGCRKRFFSDEEKRRAPGAERREFGKTKDTYACRFYQFFAESSPCERLMHYVKIRLFDHFGKPLYNAPYKLDFPGAAGSGVAKDSYATLAGVETPASGKVMWKRPYDKDDVTTLAQDSNDWEYEQEVFIDDCEDNREECVKRRLNNLGYNADELLENNIRDFQQDIGRSAPDGTIDDIFDELDKRYNSADPPERHPV